MSYQILPVEDDDIPRVTELVSDALAKEGHPEFIAATWPGLSTLEGRDISISKVRGLKGVIPADPTPFLKVVDASDGSIVASSICIYHSAPPEELPGLMGHPWPTEDEHDYAEHLHNERNACLMRVHAALKGPVTEVLLFYVDVSRQRQGIGTQLMQHLLEIDKQNKAHTVLIANPGAKTFYEKKGFRIMEDVVIPLPEKWQHKTPTGIVSCCHAI